MLKRVSIPDEHMEGFSRTHECIKGEYSVHCR
jgi:hypothetical protein